MYIPGLSCSGKGPFMGPSSSGVANTPVPPQAAFSVGQFLPCCGFISKPSPSGLTQHGFPWTRLLCQTPTPSKSAFSACLCNVPLHIPLPFHFCRQASSHFSSHVLFLYPPVSSLTSPTASPFTWSHVHPALSATLSHECLSQCAVPFSGRLILLHPVGQSVPLGSPCFLN